MKDIAPRGRSGRHPRPTVLLATRAGRVAGAERVILGVADALGDADHEITVTSCPLPWETGAPRLPVAGARGDLRELLLGRYDVVHTHLFLPGLLARARRIFDGRFRWVHTVHYDGYEALSFPRLRRWLDHHFIFPAADALVAVSPAVAGTLWSFAQTRLIENGIELSPVPSGDSGPGPDPAVPPLLGTVAMLRSEKGVDDLVRAVALLAEAGVEIRLEVAGDGPRREALERLVGELGVADRVRFRGYLTELSAFYRRLDLYVQPSRTESFGMAVFDALRHERPVVATRAGHLPTVLGDGRFGILTREGGDVPAALAGAIREALSDPARGRRRAAEGRRYWAQRLDPARTAEEHARLYREVLEPRVVTVAALATHGGGGIPRQILLQTREQARRGGRTLLLQRHDPEMDTDAARRDQWSHLTLLETPALAALGDGALGIRLRGLLSTVAMAGALWRHRRRYDVVHAHQLYSPTLAALAARVFTGRPVVVTVTSSGEGVGELRELGRLPFRRSRRLAFHFLDGVVALTPSMARELAVWGFRPDRIRVVPNAVDIPPEPDFAFPAEGPLRLLYTGRLSVEKSLETPIRAVALLREEGVSAEFHVVGGPDPDRNVEPELRALVTELELEDRVLFHGSKPSVEDDLRRTHGFILASKNEGMSSSLLEGLAWGRICLASDIPQHRDVLTPGVTGYLTPQGDPESLARALSEVDQRRRRGDPALEEMARAARAVAVERYSVASVVTGLESVFRRIRRR